MNILINNVIDKHIMNKYKILMYKYICINTYEIYLYDDIYFCTFINKYLCKSNNVYHK